MNRIKVELGKRSYPVIIAEDGTDLLKSELRKLVARGKLFICFDANFHALHGRRMLRGAGISGKRVIEIIIPSGEKAKNEKSLQELHTLLLSEQISRNDFVLACGGGVTTDLVGYTAATILRGVHWGVVATTLLGMVDAGIGGKTGINHSLGKNLIGAIWQPAFVFCDPGYLHTLPERHLLAGIGEIAKYAGLSRDNMLKRLRGFLQRGDLLHMSDLLPLIRESVAIKCRIISRDETEQGERMILNLGHTFAHAIEQSLGYGRLLHGEAVILGLYAALELGRLSKIELPGACDEYRNVLSELMRRIPRRRLRPEAILKAMKLDKKRLDGRQRFVLLKGMGRPIFADSMKKQTVRTALNRMIKQYNAVD